LIICGDALAELRKLPDESVQVCITSPPYYGLRDYGIKGQLGLEKTPQEYIARLVEAFHEVRRILKKNGTLWLVLGDSYAGSRCGGGNSLGGRNREACKEGKKAMVISRRRDREPIPRSDYLVPGLKPKDLIGIPWWAAFALQEDGWYLRQDIIWAKPNPMPESVTDRCTKAHEYIFLLAKNKKYYYDADAIKEASVSDHDSGNGFLGRQGGARNSPISGGAGNEKQWERQADVFSRSGPVSKHILPGQSSAQHRPRSSAKHARTDPQSSGRRMIENTARAREVTGVHELHFGPFRNRRSIWTVATRSFNEAHFAVFPTALVEPMILAGCPKGGLVLDPFFGAGTVGFVAARLGREFIGIELNPAYCEMARKRINGNLFSKKGSGPCH
jgi:DNA modification methylase